MGLLKAIGSVKTRWWAITAVAAIVGLAFAANSGKEKQRLPDLDFDPEKTPTMFTDSVETLISDSGYVRYKIIAPVWYMYSEAKKPNWKFSEGLYMEMYNDTFAITTTAVCDSAVYLEQERLWEFIGNVRIINRAGDRFMTQHMFWNTQTHKLRSDSFMHIEKPDRVIEGFGFETDEQLREYTVRRPTMIIPMSQFRQEAPQGEPAAGPAPMPPDPYSPEDVVDDRHHPAQTPGRRPSPPRPGGQPAELPSATTQQPSNE